MKSRLFIIMKSGIFWRTVTGIFLSLLLIDAFYSFTYGASIHPLQSVNQQKVSGRVTDEQAEPLTGVTVAVEGTTIGTITDKDGNYTIKVENGQTISFSFVGYKTKELKYTGQKIINVQLEVLSTQLNEFVTVGYAKVRKQDQTGSVVILKGKDLNMTNSFSVNSMLEGKVPGAQFQKVTAQPGGETWVNIRGAISPTGSNYPLYVIDGVPLTSNFSLNPSLQGLGYDGGIDQDPLISINPNDIESITVLEGPSATAIYGSNAANGVILITTKHGEKGKIKVSYNGYYTVQTPKKFLDLLDAKRFMQLTDVWGHEQWLYNNGIAPYGNTDSNTVALYFPQFSMQEIANAGKGTNWLGAVMNKQSYTTSHNLSISGGSENTQYYSSFNYMKDQGVLKHSDLDRYSGRFNITSHIGSRIVFNSSLLLSEVNSTNASTGSTAGGGEMWPMLLTAIYFPTTISTYNSNGNFNKGYLPNMYNPAAFLIMTDNTSTKRVLFAPNVDINILKGLKVTVNGGIDLQGASRKYFLPVAALSFMNPQGQAQISEATSNNLDIESYLTYTKEFNHSRLSAVLGAGYYNTNGEGNSMIGYSFFTDAFGADNIGIASNKDKNTMSSYKWENNKLSQFARLDYSLMDRYLITATIRRDGASFFAQNKKWGIFPGVAVAWKINEESFLKNKSWLSDLKLRLGYGEAGNASIIGNNALSLYQVTPGLPYVLGNNTYSGIIQTQIGNPNLTWENDISMNVGLDFGFWNGRLSGTVNVYSRTAKDLLDFEPLPINNPVTSMAANIGSTRSNGFDVSLKSKNIVSPNFSWSTDFTLTHYKVFWVSRNPMVALPKYVGLHDPLHAIYGWVTDGIIKSNKDVPPYMPKAQPGNIRYIDINHDGKLDINDVVYLGNSDPKLAFGFGNTFTYKAFDLKIYFYGTFGVPMWNGYLPYGSPSNLSGFQPVNTDIQVKNAWSTFNPTGTDPGIALDSYSGANPTGITNFGLKNVYYIRLNNVSLGYTLPSRIVAKSNFIRQARLYLNLGNIWLFTNYDGIDPEMANTYDPYPTTWNSTLGINISF